MKNGTGEKWGERAANIGMLLMAFAAAIAAWGLLSESASVVVEWRWNVVRIVMLAALVVQFILPLGLRWLGDWVDKRCEVRQVKKEQDALTHPGIQESTGGSGQAPHGRD